MTEIKNIELKHTILDFSPVLNNDKLEGIKIDFAPSNKEMIYHRSDGTIVRDFPKNLSFTFDIKSCILFSSLLLETISSYLFSMRNKIYNSDLRENINSKLDDKFLKVRVSKYFFRNNKRKVAIEDETREERENRKEENERGRYKISIAFYIKKTEELNEFELVNINFSKRDVLILLNILKKYFAGFKKIKPFSIDASRITEKEEEHSFSSLAKVDTSVLLDSVWLHGQELLNLMYIVEQLIFKLNIEENLEKIQTSFRQLKVSSENIPLGENNSFNIMNLYLNKMDENDTFLNEPEVKIPLTSFNLAALYLSIDLQMLIARVENLSTSPLGENTLYYLSTKESLIGVSVKKKIKGDKEEWRLILNTLVKDGVFNVENEEGTNLIDYIKYYDENDVERIAPVCKKIELNLKEHWLKFISGLSYGLTKEYLEEEKEYHNVIFNVVSQERTGLYKYQVQLYSAITNKAPIILFIKKYRMDGTLISVYRQPLFEKYVYELLIGVLAAYANIEKIDFVQTIESSLKYSYKSMKTVVDKKRIKKIDFGIKKDTGNLIIGNLSSADETEILSTQDALLLNLSAFSRLTKGQWLPFVGEKIAIGPDGWFTDLFDEVNLEENKKGTIWAARFYAASIFHIGEGE